MNTAQRWEAIEKLLTKALEHFDKLPIDDKADHNETRIRIHAAAGHAHEMVTYSRAESDRHHKGVRR